MYESNKNLHLKNKITGEIDINILERGIRNNFSSCQALGLLTEKIH